MTRSSSYRDSRSSTRRTRAFVPLLLASVMILLLSAGQIAAQGSDVDLDLRAGYYKEVSENFIGGGVLGRFHNSRWHYNPNAEWVLVDNGDLYTLNLDFHYDLHPQGDFDFWLGGGPALVVRKPQHRDSKTDVGLNLLAGVGFMRQYTVRPFVQGKLILVEDDTEAVIAVGLRLF